MLLNNLLSFYFKFLLIQL